MKHLATILLTLAASPALAHPGHLLDAAGHDHVAAGIAIGMAIGVALWGALKDKRNKAEDEAEEPAEGELQEA